MSSRCDNTVKFCEKEVPGFEILVKEKVWHQKLLTKLAFFVNYLNFWTTLYPKVYKPEKAVRSSRVLQHEAVHLLDMQTFFGLMPSDNAFLRYFNTFLFAVVYLFPQCLGILAFLALTGNPWWLFCLLFLLPLPAPGRALAELRGYRRSRELGTPPDHIVKQFTSKNYYFMFPFKRFVGKKILKESPYKKVMDEL